MKDGEAGWTAVVRRRRKKSARSEDGDNSANWNVRLDLIKGRNLVRYGQLDPWNIYSWKLAGVEMGGSQTSPISSQLELK